MTETKINLDKFNLTLQYHLTSDNFDAKSNSGSSHFVVTISRKNKSLTTQYSMGCAHRHYPKELRGLGMRPYDLKQGIKRGGPIVFPMRMTNFIVNLNSQTIPNNPQLRDVLYSLLIDAQAGNQSFHDFCSEFGYNDDSIKNKATWKACQKTYYNLLNLFTYEELEELRELFQDY